MSKELSDELQRFVSAPWLSKAYVCEQLWGNRSKSLSAKLSNKITGAQRQRFKPEEVKKLEEIRENILKEI